MRKRYNSLYERLIANIHHYLVQNEQDCWVWGAARNAKGYPRINIRKAGRLLCLYAHRLMYELVHGPIPPGYEIDHLCEVESCINPDHLQAVPGKVNTAYRWGRRA
jgi:hypothetical protein